MTKPLQTKQRKLPGSTPLLQHIRPLMLPMVISVGFCVASANVFGQGIAAANEDFVRNNSRNISVSAAAPSYSGEDLRRLHPTNLLRALQIIDPSICGVDARETNGSNPNAVPATMSLQGTQRLAWQFTNADALPLIIVDGHSETIERLQDFDILRIASVTVLKDASATALYGVRAGHGAIVITTKTPAKQHLQLTYNFDGMFQSASLGSFDVLSAGQKLALEKQAGLYNGNDALYNERMEYVRKNGSTDWLHMPVRTAFSHKHRVTVDGGDDNLRYRGVLYANPQKGVMKGSDRIAYGASAFIGYTTDKLEVSNELSIDMIDVSESMYGAMYQWVELNGYYAPYDQRGEPYSTLGAGTFSEQESPLYETSLSSFDQNKIARVNNNLTLRWAIDDRLSIAGQFNMTHDAEKQSHYLSPQSLRFLNSNADADQKGLYRIIRNKLAIYQEKLWADYRLQGSRNSLRVSLGAEVYAATMTDNGYTGMGMSSDHMNYISFAQRYAPGKPSGLKTNERVLSGYGVVSWALDDVLFADLSGRIDKSSLLAPENRTAGSYALMAAYDLKKAAFESCSMLKALRLTAGYGSTAGYTFDYEFANPLYGYNIDDPYLNGLGSKDYSEGLVSFHNMNVYNPALKWKTTRGLNIGIQTRFSTVSLAMKYYNSKSDNLLTLDKQNEAFGSAFRYTNNGAIRNSGFEYQVSAGILEHKGGGLNLTLFTNGVINRSEVTKVPDYTSTELHTSNINLGMPIGAVRGDAADAIYAVRSAGIDPTTGREQFYLRDGSVSKDPKAADLVCLGSATPKLRGTFGAVAAWRNLDLAINFTYSLGGKFYDIYTQRMVDQAGYEVNLPKAGTDKWSPENTTGHYQGTTDPAHYASSRFVSTRNILSLASLRVGYAVPKRIASKIAMQGLKISFTCDDLFYSSSVKTARGFYYPYAASFILSLQATF